MSSRPTSGAPHNSAAGSPGRVLVLTPQLRGAGEKSRGADARLAEAVGLARAINLTVAGSEVVRLSRLTPATLIGSGAVALLDPLHPFQHELLVRHARPAAGIGRAQASVDRPCAASQARGKSSSPRRDQTRDLPLADAEFSNWFQKGTGSEHLVPSASFAGGCEVPVPF